MQALGNYFRARCFLVRSILLSGHGTRPGDLLYTHSQDWVKAVDFGVQSFDGQVEDLYLAGYSIGGALAFHHALITQQSEKDETKLLKKESTGPIFKGLFLFSPALKARNDLLFLAGTASFFY